MTARAEVDAAREKWKSYNDELQGLIAQKIVWGPAWRHYENMCMSTYEDWQKKLKEFETQGAANDRP